MEKEKRQWLYNKNADATIFTGEEAIIKALREGWVDSPAKFKEEEILDAVIVDTALKAELEALELEALLEMAKELEIPARSNTKKETLVEKILAFKAEQK